MFWGEFARREPAANQMLMASLFGWLAQGKLKPQVTQTFPLADAPKALEALLARRVIGKLVIRP